MVQGYSLEIYEEYFDVMIKKREKTKRTILAQYAAPWLLNARCCCRCLSTSDYQNTVYKPWLFAVSPRSSFCQIHEMRAVTIFEKEYSFYSLVDIFSTFYSLVDIFSTLTLVVHFKDKVAIKSFDFLVFPSL